MLLGITSYSAHCQVRASKHINSSQSGPNSLDESLERPQLVATFYIGY